MGHIKILFGGRVKIETLPFITSITQPVEGPKRLSLEKGELAEIYDGEEPIRHIAYIELIAGKTRGGHYHNRYEYFYIIRGEIEFEFIDVDTKTAEKVNVKEGDLIFLSPKIAHQIKTIKAGHVIEFSSSRFRPEDTIAYPFS